MRDRQALYQIPSLRAMYAKWFTQPGSHEGCQIGHRTMSGDEEGSSMKPTDSRIQRPTEMLGPIIIFVHQYSGQPF